MFRVARTIERIIPADPANPASFEQRIMEAGQVRVFEFKQTVRAHSWR